MKFIKHILLIFVLLFGLNVTAETLSAGVSKVEMVPNSFYGSWRVTADC